MQKYAVLVVVLMDVGGSSDGGDVNSSRSSSASSSNMSVLRVITQKGKHVFVYNGTSKL